jgi:hypothetical protein
VQHGAHAEGVENAPRAAAGGSEEIVLLLIDAGG